MRFTHGNKQIVVQFGSGLTKAVALLIGISVGIFLLQSLAWQVVTQTFGFIPSYAVGGLRVWQFVSAIFLHGSTQHLVFNMIGLYMFGGAVERVLREKDFLFYFLICGVSSFVLTFLLYGIGVLPNAVYLGASGAVYGLLVAYSLLFPKEKVLLFFVIPMQAKWLAVIFGGVEFMLAFRNDGINHFGHLGGIATGVGYFAYMRGSGFVLDFYRR